MKHLNTIDGFKHYENLILKLLIVLQIQLALFIEY